MKVKMLVTQSCLILCNPMDYIAHQAPLSVGFSRQECWSGLPFPSPEDLPDPGIEPMSSALAGGFFTSDPPAKPWTWITQPESILFPVYFQRVAQMVKNLPAVQETQVQSLGQEDPLEKGMATHSSILAWRIPWTKETGGLYSPWGCKELDTT